jgi:hypothetical protein
MTQTRDAVLGVLGFSEPLPARMKYHANDSSLDVMNVVPLAVPIEDARRLIDAPTLDREGFALVHHTSKVSSFRDQDEVQRVYGPEIRDLLLSLTGADHVEIRGAGILRFGEKSHDSGQLNNSKPARFVHIDVSDATAQAQAERSSPPEGKAIRRVVQYNVWRVLSKPPQDVPLAVCDARSLSPDDLIFADAMFDKDGEIVFSFEGLVVRHNPAQRWYFFSDMRSDEALVFKTHDSDLGRAHHVPHGAFDNPACPSDTPPRASIEMRGTAFWYG